MVRSDRTYHHQSTNLKISYSLQKENECRPLAKHTVYGLSCLVQIEACFSPFIDYEVYKAKAGRHHLEQGSSA